MKFGNEELENLHNFGEVRKVHSKSFSQMFCVLTVYVVGISNVFQVLGSPERLSEGIVSICISKYSVSKASKDKDH